MGINGFEGVGPEWLLFQKKDGPCLRFLKEIGFEGGERETDLWVHALFEIAPIFLSFPLKLSAAVRPKRKERLFSTRITPLGKGSCRGD